MKTGTKIGVGVCSLIVFGIGYFAYSLDSNPALFIKTALTASSVYEPTELPQQTEDLFEVRGDLEQQEAYLYVQGGPALRRNIDNRNPLLLLPNANTLLRVHPIQTQMMNKTVLNASPMLTAAQGAYEHALNAEILHRTVGYFKDLGKTVHVICHSYGTLICHEYLNSVGNEADNIVLMGFPLDMDLRTFEVGRGEVVRWVDGLQPVKEDPFPDFPLKSLVKPGLDDLFANMFRLIEIHAKKRYTVELENTDFSDVIYVYGKFDEASGRPTQEELGFLATKNAEVVETVGGHRSMWSPAFLTSLHKRLSNGVTIKASITSGLSKVLESTEINSALQWYANAKLSNIYNAPDETELNHLAYRYLDEGKLGVAIELFQLVTREFPNSYNAFDSLGEAHAANGNYELATLNYKKSILLNPEDSAGERAIRALNNE